MNHTQADYQRALGAMALFVCLVMVICQTLHAQASKENLLDQIAADKATILAWNIEIGGSEVETILDQLKMLMPCDVLALSEVPRKSADQFVERWGRKDAAFIGTKGGEACLLVAWDPSKLDCVDATELTQFDGQEFAPGIQTARR